MPHIDKNTWIGQADQTPPAAHRLMDQRCVFRQIDLRVSKPLVQQCFSIYQRASVDIADEHPPMQLRASRPESAAGQFQHKSVLQAGQVGLIRQDRRYLVAQPIRSIPIIIISVRGDLTARFPAGQIALAADGHSCGKTQIVNTR
jgi:hypothetical protein